MALSQIHVQVWPESLLPSRPNVERATMYDALAGETTTCPARGYRELAGAFRAAKAVAKKRDTAADFLSLDVISAKEGIFARKRPSRQLGSDRDGGKEPVPDPVADQS